MRATLTALQLVLATAGCYDTRLLDGHAAPLSAPDAAAGDDAAPSCGPDGTVCAPTSDPCLLAGRCLDDVCQPIANALQGTPCAPAPDACHTAGICDGAGRCAAPAALPDGAAADPSQPLVRCCQGKPSRMDSPDSCGACGISCNGRDCLATHGGHYYCGCWGDADCWSGCCTSAYGVPWVCAAASCSTGDAIACPGNASNSDGHPDGPRYCHY
jgi:hypothetical protein